MRRSILWCAALLLLAGCSTFAPQTAPRHRFKIVAYVFGERADIESISARKLTHINYAFATVNPQGEIWFENPESPQHIARLQALKAQNPDLKLIVSVGGWGADFFSDAALSEASRCRFADSAVDLVKRYALDGIDIDWEYPGQPGPGMIYRAEDRENFTLMLKKLREELDLLGAVRHRTGTNHYALTVASAAGEYFRHTEMDRLHPFVDWFNVMTYDMAGDWSDSTGHHTALYRSAAAPGEESTEAYVKQHLAAGIPPEKVVVGAAFYGKAWKNADRTNAGLYQRMDRFDGSYSYNRIASELTPEQGYERRWDADAHAPYMWNPQTGRFVTFDDPQSVAEKAQFVRKLGLGGVMYWEHSEDPREVLLSAIYEALK